MPIESELNVTGFRVTRTLDRLVYDLLLILRDTLSDPEVDLLHNQDDVENLELDVLELLSRPIYAKCLLWRDYHPTGETWHRFTTPRGDEKRVYDQAINYFYQLLRRPLGLAQNRKERPTNMHLLLQAGCRHGPAERGWPEVTIRRDHALRPGDPETDAFARTDEALSAQHQAWSEALASARDDPASTAPTIALRRHAEFGPLWLIVADYVAEIVPELSLFHDVLRTLPTPLPAAFAEDAEFQKRLQKVLETLNERYGLLRSCGLDPNRWWSVDALSVSVLKDIKALRQRVAQHGRDQPDKARAHAYETAFNTLKGGKSKFAGCATFSAFMETEVGHALLWGDYLPLPPADSVEDDDDAEDASDVSGSSPADPATAEWTSEEADRYIAQYAPLADDALMTRVVQVIFAGHTLDEPEILAELHRLIDQNDLHRRRFGKLPDHKLTKALCEHATALIQRAAPSPA